MDIRVQSASDQKLCKISIMSSESNFSVRGSIDQEVTPRASFSNFNEESGFLIQKIAATLGLSRASMDGESNPMESLHYFVNLVCSEYLKATQLVNEIALADAEVRGTEDVSVNLMKDKKPDAISRIFDMPENGVNLSRNECKNIASLLIGALRDSASGDMAQRITRLQEKIIGLDRLHKMLKEEYRAKSAEADRLRNEIA